LHVIIFYTDLYYIYLTFTVN